jgi:glycerol kinase
MYARGTLVGMTRGTGAAHIVRAALEAIAYQSADLLSAMTKDAGCKPENLRVDGGASANSFLMQFQSDIMDMPIQRPAVLETTALGAALLAGLAAGVYPDVASTAIGWHVDSAFEPQMTEAEREAAMKGWGRAVDAALYWAKGRE